MDILRQLTPNVAQMWEDFKYWIIGVGTLVLLVCLFIAGGYSFWATIGMALVVAFVLVFSPNALVIGLTIAILFKATALSFKKLIDVWFAGPASDKFYTLIADTHFVELVLLFTLLVFLTLWCVERINSILGSFRPVEHNHNKTKNVNRVYPGITTEDE